LRVFIVIPAYNEHKVIYDVVSGLSHLPYSIIVIDDGSDGSLYNHLHATKVIYLRHKINLGQGAALQTGIEFALSQGAEYIITFDADGQHSPDDIEKLLSTIKNTNVDVVLGSRFLDTASSNMSFSRKVVLHTGRIINYFFTGLLLTDAHYGLRGFKASAAAKIKITENRMAHATEILNQIKRNKMLFKEVPVNIV